MMNREKSQSLWRHPKSQTVITRNVNVKVAATEAPEGNEYVMGNQGEKEVFVLQWQKVPVEWCLTVMWKAECFNYDLELRRFPSRVESATWLLFAVYKLRKKLVNKQANKKGNKTR